MNLDTGWARSGRAYAWLGAEGFLIGAVILLLLNLGIGAPTASGLNQYVTTTWLVVIGSAFLLIGMLALIPVGLTLRELVGRSVGAELMTTFLLAGSLLGISSRLLLIPLRLSLGNLVATRGVQPQVLNNFLLTYSVIENATNWLLYGWFLLTGLALYHASRAAVREGVLPRRLAQLALAAAGGCWLVVILTLMTVAIDAPVVAVTGKAIMAVVGVVVLPVWLTWLGREFGRVLKPDRLETAEATGGDGARARPRAILGSLRWRWSRPL